MSDPFPYLSEPIDGFGLFLFQLLFGLAIAVETWIKRKSTLAYFSSEGYHFPYQIVPWLEPARASVLNALLYLKVLAFVAVACFIPYAPVAAFLLYLYFFLLDKTTFNNHYYLILLLLVLMMVTGSGWEPIPRWQLLIFQLQLFIVYFYGGVAKLNVRWLRDAQPVDSELKRFFGRENRAIAYLFAWGGCLFDLVIIPLLMLESTRLYAIPFYLLFHLLNAWMLSIGVFPWMNLAALALFINGTALREWIL